MKKSRQKFTSAFKIQLANEALKERDTLAELSKRFEVHLSIIRKWEQEFIENCAAVFEKRTEGESRVDPERLYTKIG